MTATDTQDDVRFTALMDVRQKLSQQLAETNPKTDVLTNPIERAIRRLASRSTKVLQELSAADPTRLIGILFDGTENETLIREYIAYFPHERHIRSVRQALGLENLLTDDLGKRQGISAAMNVTHAGFVVNVKRDGAVSANNPRAVHLTAEAAEIITSHAHRELDIIGYMQDRNITAAEIDAEHLRDYLAETSALSRGIL